MEALAVLGVVLALVVFVVADAIATEREGKREDAERGVEGRWPFGVR